MAYTDGVHGWCTRMAYTDGVHGWRTRMAYLARVNTFADEREGVDVHGAPDEARHEAREEQAPVPPEVHDAVEAEEQQQGGLCEGHGGHEGA